MNKASAEERGGTVFATGLIRGIARIDSEGKILIPKNILAAAELGKEDVVELRLARSVKAMRLTISKCSSSRQT